MKKVFIIGGAGNVGRSLAQQLTRAGHQALAMYRHPEQEAPLKLLGATPVRGDLQSLDEQALADLIAGSDVLVFSAGAGGKGGKEMTNAIDGRGLEIAVAAAQKAGVSRFLLVSAFPEAGRGKAAPSDTFENYTFENYMAVKKQADVHLAASPLDWVILRPGTLTNDAGSGRINAGLAIPYGLIPREDVATTLAALIDTPAVSRKIIEVTAGDTPALQAMQALA
ncbi:TPA: SDR family oxidoreductase [Serratia rubidaea]|nr:SDR family oxidoreductase [Serratia rubidaea]HDJ1449882.1 SDR family oxidoreductase [Serratia rubidaea]HDJ1463537.1 SDR family oxidoreductase [Serratia rubidaea]HDJ2773545.1 SDR family oxidoreductase [Serratia rubidaea]